jgi:hypothetical protein
MTGFNSKRMMAREVDQSRLEKLMIEASTDSSGKWMSIDNVQNLADLIIQECLNICEDMGNNGKDGHYCADKIAKTFRS